MKKLPIANPSFRFLEKSFAEWLDVLGYAPSTVYYMPIHIRELLHYLETEGIQNITEMDAGHITSHYQSLKERANVRRGGGIRNNYLNKHIQAIRMFTDYLRQVGRMTAPLPALKNEEGDAKEITVLSSEEIRLLFEATRKEPETKSSMPQALLEAFGSRDRAMLAVYYGCGLRRNEGVSLDVGDVHFDKALLQVRKGKNYKERWVPISKQSLRYLTEYIYDHRGQLLRTTKTEALFISYAGKRMGGQGMILRLKALQHRSTEACLQEKEIGLHSLRHSIATHLLAAGMKLESISRFLGHSSLESTQIYTHLLGMDTPQPYRNIPSYEKIQLAEDEK